MQGYRPAPNQLPLSFVTNPFAVDPINSGNHLYSQPTCPTNVIQPIFTTTTSDNITNASHAATTTTSTTTTTSLPHKRRSVDLEEDSMAIDEPPSKQILSERNLFKKFGSLNIGGMQMTGHLNDDGDDEVLQGKRSQSTADKVDQEEFNRYVYLLFKDIEGNNSKNPFKQFSANSTIDRLAREERDKLSKAVILWSPPARNRFCNSSDDDEDDSGVVADVAPEVNMTIPESQSDVTFAPG